MLKTFRKNLRQTLQLFESRDGLLCSISTPVNFIAGVPAVHSTPVEKLQESPAAFSTL